MPVQLYKNVTKKTIEIPVTRDEVEPGQVYSISTEWPQPPLQVEGLVHITEMTRDEQAQAEKDHLQAIEDRKKEEEASKKREAAAKKGGSNE